MTTSENVQHSFDFGDRTPTKYWQGKRGVDCYSSKMVSQFDLSGNLINKFGSTSEAKRITGINQGHISEVCRGERKSAGGYFWSY